MPAAPEEVIPAVEPTLRVAPKAFIKALRVPLITPAGAMISVPLLVKALVVKPAVTVPLTVPVAVVAKVILNLVDVNERVTPVPTVNEVVMVIILPAVPAARVQFPLMVRLFNIIEGTAVMFEDAAPIITSSLVEGAPLGLQFVPVVHTPPVVGDHVLVAAWVKEDMNKTTINKTATLTEERHLRKRRSFASELARS